jgi:two-component system LytT family response regulator
VVADCGDCASAVDVVRRLAPHLVLLDVEMPRCDSFQVLEALDRRARPFVVFLAADSAHAARAFEVRALDYLIKPPHPNRLRAALDRARREIDTLDARNPSDSLPAPGKGRADQVDRLLVKTRGRIVFLPIDEIDWVEAAGNYVVARRQPEPHAAIHHPCHRAPARCPGVPARPPIDDRQPRSHP